MGLFGRLLSARGCRWLDRKNFVFVHKHKVVTKTIGLADDAYDRLAALKREHESFSDVVRRLTGARMLRRLAGTMDDETAEHYRFVIQAAREHQDERRHSRIEGMLEDTESQDADDGREG